jgi:hypothetical protein
LSVVDECMDYNYLISVLPDGEIKIKSRTDFYKEEIISFLEKNKLNDFVFLSEDLLFHAIIDYFADIVRLKNFHDIDFVNDPKIYSYSLYWFLRRKPLQIKSSLVSEDITDEISSVNERFAFSVLMQYLAEEEIDAPILESKKQQYFDFANTLLYYLKYRDYSPKTFEMIILAYRAGRVFQYSVDNKE